MKKSDKDNKGVIKKVVPIDSENVEESVEDVGGHSTTFVGGTINTIKNGFHNLQEQKFGLTYVANAASFATDKVSSFLNLSKKSASVVLALALALGVSAGGIGVYNYNRMNVLLKQEAVGGEDDCVEEIKNMKVQGSDVGDTSGLVEEYAKKAWSVGKAIGMSDEQCAGMLGNMQRESGMDPTTIEGVFTDPFNIDGPVKSAAKSDMCSFFIQYIVPVYIKSGWSIQAHTTKAGCSVAGHVGSKGGTIHTSAYEGADGHFTAGLGLFGFTGPNSNAVMKYAESANRGWWEFDIQMAFSIDTTGGYGRAQWVHDWAQSGGPSTPEEAAVEWNKYFEGATYANDEKAKLARQWYDRFAGTMGDQEYAESILALANSVEGGAVNKAVAKALDECVTAEASYDNSNIAKAAVAYAYRTTDEGRGNDGTELYRTLHDIIFPGSSLYQSCDVGVGTAVVWSGADDGFPPHATVQQELYMMAHPEKWEDLGMLGSDIHREDLKPGDVCVINGGGHVVLFVGNEEVQKKYAGSPAEIVSASLGERSPGCENWYDSAMYNDGRGQYHVFRNKKPEENPKYINAVAGMDLDDGK